METEFLNVKDLVIKKISDVDKTVKNDKLHNQLDIFDCLFENENPKKIIKRLLNKNDFPSYISYCIQWYFCIRPKEIEKVLEILTIFSFDHNISYFINNIIRDLFIHQGLIEDNLPKKSFQEIINLFPAGSIELAIKNDDAEEFSRIINEPFFDATEYIEITWLKKFDYLDIDSFSELNYMQLICLFGSVKCFKTALSNGNFSIKGTNKYAIAGGNNEIISILKKEGVNFDNCFGTAVAFHRDEICDWLLENYNCDAITLTDAVKFNNMRAFYFILKNNISDDINSAFFSVIDSRNFLLFMHLRETYAIEVCEIYTTDRIRSENDLEALKFLVDNLHFSISLSHSLDEDKSITEYVDEKASLYYACDREDYTLAKKLIEEKEFFVNRKYSGRTILDVVAHKNNLEFLKYLVEKCKADIKSIRSDSLCVAAYNNNLEMIKYLVEKCKVSTNGKLEKGNTYERILRTPLQIASANGNLDIVKYLVEKCGADVDEKSEETFSNGSVLKRTALDIACENTKIEIIDYLIDTCTANVNEITSRTLHTLLENNKPEIFKYLVKKCSINVNEKSYKCKSLLSLACEKSNLDIIKFLVEECHAKTEEKDPIKMTLLHIACTKNNLELVKYLCNNCHLGVEEKNTRGETPLHIACKKNSLEIAKFLINECNSNIEEKDNGKKNALSIASENGFFQMMKFLLEERHAKIEDLSKNSLINACIKSDFELIKYLYGISHDLIKTKQKDGQTVLHIACANENLEIVKFLVEECHMNVEETDKEKETALTIACENNHFETVKYLVEQCHANNNNDSFSVMISACESNNLEMLKYLAEKFDVKIETVGRKLLSKSEGEVREYIESKLPKKQSLLKLTKFNFKK